MDHGYRVLVVAERIGEQLKLPPDELERLRVGAFLHDIGKFRLPYEIALKTSHLTEHEMGIMQKHSALGAEIVKVFRPDLSVAVLHHHENYDGSGYPLGLKGDAIDPLARIFRVADSYDAAEHDRHYHVGMFGGDVLKSIVDLSGHWYDPRVVDALMKVFC